MTLPVWFLLQLFAGHLVPAASSRPAPRFEAQTIDRSVSIGYGLAIGDVDGDGRPDILLADKKAFVWYRNGDWKRFVLADSLTVHDNVCIAARDLDGDGKVEVAVGAQWNPGETADAGQSGSVHYLERPADPTQKWKAVPLHHEPTVHRMQWVRWPGGSYALVVAPLHGRGNKGGAGAGARLLAYRFPPKGQGTWTIDTLEKTMHLTHNFDVVETGPEAGIYLAGKEGIARIPLSSAADRHKDSARLLTGAGAGEVRLAVAGRWMAAVRPMHGDQLVVYRKSAAEALLLDDGLKEGHALALADLAQTGTEQVVAGWRVPNSEGKVGIRLYTAADKEGTRWTATWIDENGMACEDLKVADLDGNGRPDIIASGRATHNLVIYWNR
ncbi:MAG TPA: VCBS repeat-containing protein [Chitinophagaceae bacterium]|jgi:hypothetical protein|nr:VCBS repeat-containing protein [Chitinophagaceae bacterium]